MNNAIILDGSKFDWRNGTVSCDGLGRVDDHREQRGEPSDEGPSE